MKILLLLISSFSLFAAPSQGKIDTIYNSLDEKSLLQHLAFYQLYKDNHTGQKALKVALDLLSNPLSSWKKDVDLSFDASIIDTIIHLVNKQSDQKTAPLSSSDVAFLQEISSHLANRKLKGFLATTEEEVLQLPVDEIDLARGLFLSELQGDETQKLYSYEAMIDLMALQILAKLQPNATPESKIAEMNRLIFEEMAFRFPPQSLYAKDIDIYTFLPSVLDSRKGVCLGVSILYICLAQRLGIPLEMVTPPGHIYVRYQGENKTINIETTARGVHLDSEEYLSIDTKGLQLRSIKEVIGLAHFNHAATFWHKEDYPNVIAAYLKAKPYLPNDMLLTELLGVAYLLNGNQNEAITLLKQVEDHLPDYAVSRDYMAKEYLNGLVGIEGIKAIFKPVDETRESLLQKLKSLQKVVDAYPKFTTGLFALATTWLQLHREKEALETFETYHTLDPFNPTAEYFLAELYAKRYDYNKAWQHLLQAEKLVQEKDHHPKELKEFKKELSHLCPLYTEVDSKFDNL